MLSVGLPGSTIWFKGQGDGFEIRAISLLIIYVVFSKTTSLLLFKFSELPLFKTKYRLHNH